LQHDASIMVQDIALEVMLLFLSFVTRRPLKDPGTQPTAVDGSLDVGCCLIDGSRQLSDAGWWQPNSLVLVQGTGGRGYFSKVEESPVVEWGRQDILEIRGAGPALCSNPFPPIVFTRQANIT